MVNLFALFASLQHTVKSDLWLNLGISGEEEELVCKRGGNGYDKEEHAVVT